MKKYWLVFLITLAFASQPGFINGAGKIDLIKKWLPFSDDIAKIGKKAPRATPNQIEAITKQFPVLAGKNPELINGVIALEKAAQKNPAAGRFMESGLNPARIAAIAEKHPDQLKLADDIGEMFAKATPQERRVALPARAAAALGRIDGNYAKAGESFFEMARRGGQEAVKVAEKLYSTATSGSAKAAVAAGLLAWHMADPEGAEHAVKQFFSEQAAPIVSAPVEGIIEGSGKVADTALGKVEEQAASLWSKHWKLISLILTIILLFAIPNLRRLIFAVPDAFFGKLLNKVTKQGGTSTANIHNNQGSKMNIYGKGK